MKLAELIEMTDNLPALRVTNITDDSRQVSAGSVFFALKGNAADGCLYAADSEKKGAVAIIAETGSSIRGVSIPVVEVSDIRHTLAVAAARFYRFQPEIVTAVTGTSGKTSVVSFIRQIWGETGFAAASIGTIGVIAPNYLKYGSLTTPGPIELHRFLGELSRKGVTHVAMEASSHGIDQRRLDGVRLAAAVFTNLSWDHIDYHVTFNDYFKAKMRLFDTLLPREAPAIVYADNKYSDEVIEHIRRERHDVLTVGRKGEFIRIKQVEQERFRQYAEFEFDGKFYEVMLPFIGNFQVANAAVAAGLAIATGETPAAVFRSLERLQCPPGRLDLIGITHTGAPIYVDYAHKPDALENVLKSMRSFTKGRIILVFGCGGDRDKNKRSIMGRIAASLADVVIVSDDNPRTENPAVIRRQILIGAAGALEIGDRSQAIYKAVSMLESGDTLIVAGKGHETGQIIGNQLVPFSDYTEAHAALMACGK
ncbi:MAG: 6-diaminopimelate ligase [Candidatus Tokpelaia sp. JSC085]|nr:MAG: 6-diaminopimelate ligase [Candidatus Tokpelaia sp. JSC085]